MNLSTKHKEQIFETNDVQKMKGMFLAERVLRKWMEDFIDEDTAEIVQIERKEIILERGELLEGSSLGSIQFHLSAGDIESVSVSNIQRKGLFTENYSVLMWGVTIDTNKKKFNIYLYAKSIDMASEIAKDYMEQTFPSRFGIVAVKQLDFAHIITEVLEDEEGEVETYKMEIEVFHDDNSYNTNFIVCATNAEKTKELISDFLFERFTENKQSTDFTITIISAKKIPCETLVDMEFSKPYIEKTEKELIN